MSGVRTPGENDGVAAGSIKRFGDGAKDGTEVDMGDMDGEGVTKAEFEGKGGEDGK